MDTAAAPRKRFDLVAYLKLFRFPLVFTAIADSAAGALLVSIHDLKVSTFALLAVVSGGLYFFGMALNDITDRERDKEIAPGRVLPSGRLTLRGAVVAAILCLVASFGALLALNNTPIWQRLISWGMVVAGIVAYDKVIKLPPVMGLVRGFNLILGVLTAIPFAEVAKDRIWRFGLVALPSLVYVSALTYVSTLEDSEVDRRKLRLGAAFMVFGALLAAVGVRVVAEISDRTSGMPTAGTFQSGFQEMLSHWHGILFASILAAWVLRRAWGARDKKGIMLFVRDGVGGIILLDAALVGSFEGLIPALCVAALVVPAAISVAIFKRLA